MSKSFSINIAGGNAAIGAAAQGDSSSTNGTSTLNAAVQAENEELYRLLETIALRTGVSLEAQSAAKSQAQRVIDAVETQEKSKALAALEILQKNFSWAYPVLRDFIKIAWPALLTVVNA